MDNHDATSHFDEGVSYTEAGNYEKAVEAFSAAISLQSDLAGAYNGRGVAYTELENFQNANQDYQKAIQLDPGFALAYFNRGNLYRIIGALADAVQDYTTAIRLTPHEVDAYYNRGLAYLGTRKFSLAIEDFGHVIIHNPTDEHAFYYRGVAHYMKLDYSLAIADFSQSIALGTENSDVYVQRGLAYLALGNETSGLGDLRQAVALDDNPQRLEKIRQKIAQLEKLAPTHVSSSHSGLILPVGEHRHLWSLAALVLSFVLWRLSYSVRFLFPLQLAVTFVHETGHGLTAILTGGRFLRFEILPDGSGIAQTAGGFKFLVLQMGYLGAGLFGALLLVVANQLPIGGKFFTRALAIFFITCTALFVGSGKSWVFLIFVLLVSILTWYSANMVNGWAQNLRSSERERTRNRRMSKIYRAGFGIEILVMIVLLVRDPGSIVEISKDPTGATGLLMAGALFVLSYLGNISLNVFVLNVLAFVIGFNAINDVWILVRAPEAAIQSVPNDALSLAQLTNTSTSLWIILWIVLVVLMMGLGVLFGLIKEPKPANAQELSRSV